MQNYIWILVLIFVCGYMYGFGKALLVSAAPYDSCNHTDIYMGTEYSAEHFRYGSFVYCCFQRHYLLFCDLFVQDVTGTVVRRLRVRGNYL